MANGAETDLDTDQSYRMRHDSPSFRQYKLLAGVAHHPTDLNPLEQTGAKRQNPVSFRPVYKAMLRNLVDWIETGKVPFKLTVYRGACRQRGRVRGRDRR